MVWFSLPFLKVSVWISASKYFLTNFPSLEANCMTIKSLFHCQMEFRVCFITKEQPALFTGWESDNTVLTFLIQRESWFHLKCVLITNNDQIPAIQFCNCILFLGALEAYYSESEMSMLGADGKSAMTVNKNTFKPKVSQELRDEISKVMSREIQFYYFCKQRLRKQYLALK